MQIGNPLMRSYDQNIQAGRGTEQTKGAEQSGRVNGQTELANLSEGSVFRGEITDINGDRVTISTDNKGQIMARLQADMELTVGDQMLFSVKENSMNANNTAQILIKPLFDSLYSAQQQVLERALDGTGLSPTEKNFSAAKELMEAGMPLDKANMVKLLSQSMKFEGTSMHTLAALNKMNIPVNAENIAQFERYQSLNHQLSGDIGQVADGMGDFVSAFPSETSGAKLLSVAGELVEVFQSEEATADGEAVNAPLAENNEEGAAVTQGDAAGSLEGASKGEEVAAGNQAVQDEAGAVRSAEGNADKAGTVSTEKMNENAVANGKNVGELKSEDNLKSILSKAMGGSGEISEAHNNVTANNGVVGDKTANDSNMTNTKMFTDSQLENISNKMGLTKEEVNNVSDMLKNSGMNSSQIKELLEQSNNSGEMLKRMVGELQDSAKNDQAVKNLLSSNEFKKLFSDMVKKEFALNPNEMKDPKEIDDLYNKILKQTQSFENTITAKGGDAGHFQGNSQNMQQNMQFMQELNNQMVYAQMPLKLSNQNANSELFVYADKRKLAGKRDDISVMLHLDMDHLGATDIKVTLTGTNVNARFYLNDQESVDIISDNMGQLAKQLTDRGFSLTNEVVMRSPKESPNKVVDEIIDENAEKSIKRFTFDAKT